jgi:hypothetical protein
MREIRKNRLWLGNAADLKDPKEILSAGIEAVVELADSESLASLPRHLVRCRFPLSDGADNPGWLVLLSAQTAADLIRAEVPTLICCDCGLSRSVVVASAALAIANGSTLKEELVSVTGAGPADISPGLFAQFRNLLERA